MRERYQQKLEKLNVSLYKMCSKVIDQIESSIDSLIKGDLEKAQKVIASDCIVDDMEKNIEAQCLQILLREQPVARDFRRVSTVLKMITDIERIGDHAQDIAEIVLTLDAESINSFSCIQEMCRVAKSMLVDSVEGYIKEDMVMIKAISSTDDTLDGLFKTATIELAKGFQKSNIRPEDVISLLMVAKYLERIGDHAVNVSEWAKYYEFGVGE